MKTTLFTIILIFTASFALAQSLDKTRLLYREAPKSAENAKVFLESLKAVTQTDKPVLIAYKGAGLMLEARFAKMTERLGKVGEAKKWVEKAVKNDPKNPEIRLIRLSIQENVPFIVRYKSNIDEDKKFLIAALPNITDPVVSKMINTYFEESKK